MVRPVRSLGAVCSILAGLLLVVAAITAIVGKVTEGGSTLQQIMNHAQYATATLVFHLTFGVYSVLSIVAVGAISEERSSPNAGVVRWLSILASIGLGIEAINNFRVQHVLQAQQYASADAATQKAIEAAWPQWNLDPQGLTIGVVGIWVIAVSLLALRAGTQSRAFGYIGVAAGIMVIVVMAGLISGVAEITNLGTVFGGTILLPIWWVWSGLSLTGRGPSG